MRLADWGTAFLVCLSAGTGGSNVIIGRFLWLLLLGPLLHAQHIFYSEKKDKAAQDAVAGAKEIINNGVFEKMLANADSQSKQEATTTLAYTREQMKAKLASFSKWNSVKDTRDSVVSDIRIHNARCYSPVCYVDVIEKRLEDSPFFSDPVADRKAAEDRVDQIKQKVAELEKTVGQLEDAAKAQDPEILEQFSDLSNTKAAVGYANQIATIANNKGVGNALNEISGGLDEMIALYTSAKGIWQGYRAVKMDPTSLRPSREFIQLQLLTLEQEHIAELSRIRANMRLEVGEALQNIQQARAFLQDAAVWKSSDQIEDTLRVAAIGNAIARTEADPERLRMLLDGLFQCTSVLSSEDAAVKLASNRESDEERRFSIRRSAVNASVYDQTIQIAVERLALYYKGGIKPSDIAQLIFYITNSIAVPVIAAK